MNKIFNISRVKWSISWSKRLICVALYRCDDAFYFSRTESKLQPSKSCNARSRAGILSVTNERSERGRFRRMAGRINIKKKKNTRSSGERAKRGPWKMRRIDSSVHPYLYICICIYSGQIHTPARGVWSRSADPLSLSFFPLAWYAPVDKSRLPLLKDRGIGDKAGAEWRPSEERSARVIRATPTRWRDDGIEFARHSLLGKFIDARRCYVINKERRQSHTPKSNCE